MRPPRPEPSPRRADPRQRVYFVPAFAGLGAPYWEAGARGALTGLTAECGLPEIARATLESVGFQTRDLVAAMEADCGLAIDRLRVDGGLAASDWAMQFLADILPARSNGRTRWRRPPGARPMSPGCRAGYVRRRGR